MWGESVSVYTVTKGEGMGVGPNDLKRRGLDMSASRHIATKFRVQRALD